VYTGYRSISMEVDKGVLFGLARVHCSYCLSDMLVQMVVGTVLISLLWCALLVYEPSCIVSLHKLKS
jgi:hypothetical protein